MDDIPVTGEMCWSLPGFGLGGEAKSRFCVVPGYCGVAALPLGKTSLNIDDCEDDLSAGRPVPACELVVWNGCAGLIVLC